MRMIQIHLTGTLFLFACKNTHLGHVTLGRGPGNLHTVSHNRPEEWGHPLESTLGSAGSVPGCHKPNPVARRKTGACPNPVFAYRKKCTLFPASCIHRSILREGVLSRTALVWDSLPNKKGG